MIRGKLDEDFQILIESKFNQSHSETISSPFKT
jgi:hypothetical protein